MNPELGAILGQLGIDGMDEAEAWKRFVIVVNYHRVPAKPGQPEWGFKFLLLDRRGEPEWFGRASWADRESMARETALLEALLGDPLGRQHVPEVRSGRTPRIQVQLSRYLGESAYGRRLASRSPRQWSADVEEIMAIAEPLLQRASALVPHLDPAAARAERARSLAGDLATLARAGLDTTTLGHLDRALQEAASLPIQLQHGDLWPANILRHEHRWWLIDFSECGHVWVPGYDFCHMLSSGPPAAARPWYALATGAPGDAWSAARWELAERFGERHAMSRAQVGAALVHYLVHLTAYRLRPGVGEQFNAPLMREVTRVGEFLGAPDALARLIPPGPRARQSP